MCWPAFLTHVIYVDFATGLVILPLFLPGDMSKTRNLPRYGSLD